MKSRLRRVSRRSQAGMFGFCAAGAIAAMATAQPVAAQQANGVEDDDAGMIVVTAQRREELSRDVPVTVTMVNEEQLRTANIDSLISLPKVAPGVRFDQQGAYTQPVIRGIGNTVALTQAGNSVGIYVDGFYMPNSLAIDFDFLNVESVQVLKGPQGTLFGRNATAGAILVNTAEPGPEPEAIAEVSYGRFNEWKAQGYFSMPVADGFAIGLEGLYGRSDGFARNVYDGSLARGGGFDAAARRKHPGAIEKYALRLIAKAELSDAVEFVLRYARTDKDDPTGLMMGTWFGQVDGATYPLSAGDAFPGTTFASGRGNIALNQRAGFRIKTDTFQLTGRFDLGAAELTSYTQYREEEIEHWLDSDASSASALSLGLPERARFFTQEALLNSKPGGRLQYTAGLFFFLLKNDIDIYFGQPANQALFFQENGAKSQTLAAYADVTYEIANNLFLTGGLRFSHDQIRDAYQAATDFVSGPRFFAPDFKDSKLSPRAVLRYKPSEQSSIYASFTKGYKSAFADTTRTTDGDYKAGYYLRPEDITAYEVGYKYADNALSIDFSGFWYDYKNLQNSYYQQGLAVYSNAAKSRIKGVEGAVQYRFPAGLTLSAAATYLDAKYRDYRNAGFFNPIIIPDVDGDGVPDFAQFDTSIQADASGLQVQRAPKLSGTLAANYATSLADGELVLSGNLFHTSKVYFDAAHQFGQGAYNILSARIQWTDPSDRFTLAVFGDNLTDDKYLTQASVSLVGAGTIWGKPATYGFSIRYRM